VIDHQTERLGVDHQAGIVVASLCELNFQLQLGYCCQSSHLYRHLV